LATYTVRLARATFLDMKIEAATPEEAKNLALANFRAGLYKTKEWELADQSVRAAIFSTVPE
jgi:hypothetical protein